MGIGSSGECAPTHISGQMWAGYARPRPCDARTSILGHAASTWDDERRGSIHIVAFDWETGSFTSHDIFYFVSVDSVLRLQNRGFAMKGTKTHLWKLDTWQGLTRDEIWEIPPYKALQRGRSLCSVTLRPFDRSIKTRELVIFCLKVSMQKGSIKLNSVQLCETQIYQVYLVPIKMREETLNIMQKHCQRHNGPRNWLRDLD